VCGLLAQIHRNSLLSWIMDTSAPELDVAFYLRVVRHRSMIIWLATQYPSIGGIFCGMVEPGVDAMKQGRLACNAPDEPETVLMA
jgi:hypothetical protein